MIRFLMRALGFALMIVGASPVLAAEALGSDAAVVASRVQARYDATDTMRGDFVQEVRLGTSGRVLRSQGTMHFQKPGRMRWDYVSPERQTIVADGETLWIHQPEDEQVLRGKLAHAFESQTPVSFLLGVGRLERDFSSRLLRPGEGGVLRLELTPRGQEGGSATLLLEVDPLSYDLRAAVVRDSLGNETRVALGAVERNVVLDAALFVFKRPSGTDLLEVPGSR